ncbi:MAG: hypothetical protein RR495_06955 [Anaerovoracaceae bacterium]
MKRISAILCLTVLLVMSMVQVGSAASFGVVKTSPNDGMEGMPLENLGVKVFFNQEVYNKNNEKANAEACIIVDDKGKEIPTITIFNPKDKKVALVLADASSKKLKIKPITKYTLKIDPKFKSASGEALGKDIKTSFTTINPSTSMKYSMGMMGIMVVAMIFASTKAAKKQMQQNDPKKAHEEKFNPYKVAKETGKPVEQIVAEEQKRKAKEAAKKKRHQEENKNELSSDNFRVKGPRPISEAGSTYITGRKAEAERIAAEKRAAKAARKNPQHKKPNQNKNKR